jgi:hypothetical protein
MTNHSLPSGPGGSEGDSEKKKWGYKRHQFDAVVSTTRFNGAIDNLAAGRVETRAILAILDEVNASNQRGRYMAEVLALKQESRRLATVDYSERVAQFLIEGSRRIPYLTDGLASQMAVALASAADNAHYIETVNTAVSNLLLDLDRPLKSDTRNYLRALTDKIDATRRLQEARGHLATVPSVYPPAIPESLANAHPSPEPPPVQPMVGVTAKRTLAFGATPPVTHAADAGAATATSQPTIPDDDSAWEEDESVDSALMTEVDHDETVAGHRDGRQRAAQRASAQLRAAPATFGIGDEPWQQRDTEVGAPPSVEATDQELREQGQPRLSAARTLSGTGPAAEASADELAAAKTKAAMRAALESSPGVDPASHALEEAFFASGDATSAEHEAQAAAHAHEQGVLERESQRALRSLSPSKPKLRRARSIAQDLASDDAKATPLGIGAGTAKTTTPGIGASTPAASTAADQDASVPRRLGRDRDATPSARAAASPAESGASAPAAIASTTRESTPPRSRSTAPESVPPSGVPTSRVPVWLIALALAGVAAGGVGFWMLLRNDAAETEDTAASASAAPGGIASKRKGRNTAASGAASAVAAPTPEPPGAAPPPPPPPPEPAAAAPAAPPAPAPAPAPKLPKANPAPVVRTPSAPKVAHPVAGPAAVPAAPKPPKPTAPVAPPKQPKLQASAEPNAVTPGASKPNTSKPSKPSVEPVASATSPIQPPAESPTATPKPSRTIDDILVELRQVPNDVSSIELKASEIARIVARSGRADAEHILRRMIPEEVLAGSETVDTRLLEPVRRVVALLLKKVALDKDDTRAAMAIDALGEWAKLRKHGAAAKLTLDELAEERVVLGRPPRLRALERVQARLGISNAGE